MTNQARTRYTKTGQPVLGTTFLLEAETTEGTHLGWLPVTVVGKLHGRGGSGDLIGLIVEWSDGGRQDIPWPIDHKNV